MSDRAERLRKGMEAARGTLTASRDERSRGWGSGKTFAGARKFLRLHQLNRCPGLAIAPTYGDLWRVVVPIRGFTAAAPLKQLEIYAA